MPGLVVSIAVSEGQEVKAGETLAVVEAMKMQNVLRAERDGTVKKIYASRRRDAGGGCADSGICVAIKTRHCERSEAIQSTATGPWIASSRSLSSGAERPDPLAPRNDDFKP